MPPRVFGGGDSDHRDGSKAHVPSAVAEPVAAGLLSGCSINCAHNDSPGVVLGMPEFGCSAPHHHLTARRAAEIDIGSPTL